MKCEDLTGKRFGRLIVINRAGSNKHRASLWECICDCGNSITTTGNALRCGHTKSCGCIQKEKGSQNLINFMTKGNRSRGHLSHGGRKTKLYKKWCSMKARCYYPVFDHYDRYGGRGIAVCEEWRENFAAFREWALANGYQDGLELDRIDNNGNYEPSNCRWTSREEQVRNRSNTLFATLNGVTKPFAVWCEEYDVNYKTAHAKLRRGIPVENIF